MMAESREDISGLVETLVLPLVDEPDAVSIESSDTEMGSVLIEVRVAQADAGKVIGRQGRVIKAIRREHPESNIVAIDYDPGASEVNQLNRIKLMLSTAQKNLKKELK